MLAVYNRYHEKTVKVLPEGSAPGNGEFLLSVHLLVVNSQGQLLTVQNQLFAEENGGMWDFPSWGFVRADETPAEAASRQLDRMLALPIAPERFRHCFTELYTGELRDYLLACRDADPADFRVNEEMICGAQFRPLQEILEMTENEEFVDHGDMFYERLRDLK